MAEQYTFTYDPTLPTNKDKIRAILGDTDENEKMLWDEEIDASLTWKTNLREASIFLAESIGARYNKYTDVDAGQDQTDRTAISAKYFGLARMLRRRGVKGFIVNTLSQKETYDTDTDLIQTDVHRGMHNNKEGTSSG